MPRRARRIAGGIVYHVLNRGCGRMNLFSREGDYAAFENLLGEALERTPVRLLSYCLMPSHWHLVLWPKGEQDLSQLMFWLTMTHVQRWRHARQLVGLGPLYQGRFKAFAVESDPHYLTVCRYVERNALRAGRVQKAQDWKWSSLNARLTENDPRQAMLHHWPVEQPADWLEFVNQAQNDAELAALRRHIQSGHPFGSPSWAKRTASKLGINLNPRPRGRPTKQHGNK